LTILGYRVGPVNRDGVSTVDRNKDKLVNFAMFFYANVLAS
jgi:hypothetical protein